MKTSIRYLLYVLGGFAVCLAGLLFYLNVMLPNVGPAPDITVELRPEKIERGHYLANNVMLCMDCHSQRDFSLFTGPPKPETEGAGGEVFDQSMGLPGRFISRNLTPTALGDWTDGEIFRAITTGVSKDGTALFPIMPYPSYGQLDEADIRAVIAYLRTLDPVDNELPASHPDFPVNILINTMPQKANLQPAPPKSDRLAYGKYLVTAAACNDCHTRHEKGKFVGEPFAGNAEFLFPDGSVSRSANITSHETGIGLWTKEMFVDRFKSYNEPDYIPHRVNPGDYQTVMPWMMYARMDREDLEAIYDYLMSIPPVATEHELFTVAQ